MIGIEPRYQTIAARILYQLRAFVPEEGPQPSQ